MVDSLLVSGCGVALRDDLLGGAVTRIQERTGAGEDRHGLVLPCPNSSPYMMKTPQAPLCIIKERSAAGR